MRILVALSGGIDSSVVAHLLAREGHELVGVHATLWADPLAPDLANLMTNKCCDAQSVTRAGFVAKSLSFPLHVVDFSKAFKHDIVDPFIRESAKGNTPNPCIECNRMIKFGRLLRVAEKLKCDRIASGHFARIAEKKIRGSSSYSLREAVDAEKDQSYYLYGLNQEQLAQTLFPLGEYLKTEVYALAHQFELPFDRSYHESQDLCFYPEKSPHAFLRRYLPAQAMKPGPIKTKKGERVGTHEGLPFYTVGQRRGLKIGGQKIPLHVLYKEQKSNTLIVAPAGDDTDSEAYIDELHWIEGSAPKIKPVKCQVRIRALGKKHSGTFTWKGDRGKFSFSKAISGVTPGQSMVLYLRGKILGGGIIRQALR